jgi:NAD+ kinase
MSDRDLVGLVHNPRVPATASLVDSLVESLDLWDRSWAASAADLEAGDERLARTSVIITAGGDGTILRAARAAAPHSIPILGINMGRVGFMTELTKGEALGKVPAYLDGGQRTEERMMLQASVISPQNGAPNAGLHALNDVVINRRTEARLLDISVAVDGAPLTTYRADGVIVATATGSTGYALAAGGPILSPEARIMLVQPIAAHMSLKTALVVPGESVVELTVTGDQAAVLNVDGLSAADVGPDDQVVVQCSPHVARFLRASPPSAFYATLMHRLRVRDG